MSDCVRRSSQSEGGRRKRYPSIASCGDDGFRRLKPSLRIATPRTLTMDGKPMARVRYWPTGLRQTFEMADATLTDHLHDARARLGEGRRPCSDGGGHRRT